MTATTHIVRGCPSTTGNDRQLNTTTLIRHAARTHGDQEIVYRDSHRQTYRDLAARIRSGACEDVQVVRVPGARHMSAVEKPQLVAQALLGRIGLD